MFPTPGKRRPPKFQVITPSVNPLQSPSLKNPNGTRLPNPTTAAIGSTGQFGSMAPQIVTGTAPNNLAVSRGVMQGYSPNAKGIGLPSDLPVSPAASTPPAYGGYGIGGQNTTPKPPTFSSATDLMRQQEQQLSYAQADFRNFVTNLEITNQEDPNLLPTVLTVNVARGLNLDASELRELGYVYQNGKWVNANKTNTQAGQPGQTGAAQTPDQWAQQYSDGTWGRAGAMNKDFAGTGFAQYNAANNIAYENQLRWDPKKKKYRKIGEIEAEYGYLPKTNPEKQKGRGREESQPQQAKGPSYAPSGNVSGNFNTATG